MTPEQAINILDNAVGTIQTDRANHVTLSQAIGTIRAALAGATSQSQKEVPEYTDSCEESPELVEGSEEP